MSRNKRRVRPHVKRPRKINQTNKATIPLTHLEQAARDESLGQKENTPLDSSCRIHVHSKRKRLVDADGISAKAAIDTLVLARVLEDDGPKMVSEVSYSQEKTDKDQEEETIIYIYQDEELSDGD